MWIRSLLRTNKIIGTLLLLQLAGVAAYARQPAHPAIPDQTFSVIDFGAVGDGVTLNTSAIQAALDKAGVAGGQVVIPKGVFLCGPLTLQSKTNLVLEKDAVLKLRNDVDSFPTEKTSYQNFITARNKTDIKISGAGTIDGQGQVWWDKFSAKTLSWRRPQLLYVANCERLEITGITCLNPPNTHVSLKDCEEVYIHGIKIVAPEQSKNTDGLNISVKNCLIEDCDISTGDDNIAVNFGGKGYSKEHPECENIIIRNCKFGSGHGLSIGSYTSGGLRNLKVSDCVFDGTNSAIRIKTARDRGGVVEDISYENIKISHSKWPIFISAYYPKEPVSPASDSMLPVTNTTPVYKQITLKNIVVTDAVNAVLIWGLPESLIQDVHFINVTIDAQKGIQCNNATGISFEHIKLSVAKGDRIKTFHAQVSGL